MMMMTMTMTMMMMMTMIMMMIMIMINLTSMTRKTPKRPKLSVRTLCCLRHTDGDTVAYFFQLKMWVNDPGPWMAWHHHSIWTVVNRVIH